MIMADGENSNAVAILVPVAAPARRSMRLNITLLKTVLREIDHYAQSRGMTRSALFVESFAPGHGAGRQDRLKLPIAKSCVPAAIGLA
ncbi:type II toxin-antitoxin system HicB family antitoxin [Rhizobium sp. YIM 134829]|uniref:type II toxin-antitoxin system HicB family antitoxin n=1 Tax=Rhizobium sp. YIM 134829 TaxID=3390453 RepID=UPI00397A668B